MTLLCQQVFVLILIPGPGVQQERGKMPFGQQHYTICRPGKWVLSKHCCVTPCHAVPGPPAAGSGARGRHWWPARSGDRHLCPVPCLVQALHVQAAAQYTPALWTAVTRPVAFYFMSVEPSPLPNCQKGCDGDVLVVGHHARALHVPRRPRPVTACRLLGPLFDKGKE